ncbi:MAG: hypothetical protein E6G06_02850 [Actinobacteria bacterium]|nr:MAG: hypothetical protein E6G06_02850 [Actinomycetota bacterium]
MRYHRLILEAGPNAVTVRFHPRLTVVAGVGRLERDSLVGELLGSLGGGRGGAHLELTEDSGRRLAVMRPESGRDRVVEIETGQDVSGEFENAHGTIDILEHLGLNVEAARRLCRLSATDVAASSRSDALVRALAVVDQDQLWQAADQVRATDVALKTEVEAVGAAPEDLPVIEEIERRHEEFENALERHEDVRHHALFIGGACALAAIPAALLNRLYALPFLVVALLTTVVSIRFRRRMELARKAESEALAAAGARSYIGFHLQRVNGLLQGQHNRQHLATAAEAHRQAVARWQSLAGEVAVDWALTMRERIATLAVRLADEGRAGSGLTGPSLRAVEPADLAHALVARLAELRNAGPGGQSLPLILDEPLNGVDPSIKQWMLELVGRSAGSPQVVYLTEDEDVASWARMEAVAGHLAVIEPSPEHEAVVGERLVG